MYLNSYHFIGRLADNPVLTKPDGGTSRVWMVLLANRPTAKKEEQPIRVPVVCWGAVAEAVAEHCKKGKELTISGEVRTYTKKNEDGSFTNYWEVNASSVSFGQDSTKNQAKPAVSTEAIVAALQALPTETIRALLSEQAQPTPAQDDPFDSAHADTAGEPVPL